MRPNHQNNKRMRGRNRGGKGPNPLSRSYESNGPDVKIRGTAQHIAEKYLQLARDAQASGDPVTAESYLQHAEHYLRLIAAAQEQFRQQNPSYRPFEVGGEDGDDDGDDAAPFAGGGPQPDVRFPQMEQDEFQPQPRQQQHQPREWQQQPREPREPREWQPREQREPREPREPREWQPRGDQQPREQREFQPREGHQPRRDRDDRFGRRGPRPEMRGDRPDRPERGDRPERAPVPAPAEDDAGSALPAFITAPVRAVAPADEEPQASPVTAPVAEGDEETGRFPLRQRRRRAPRRAEGEAPVPTGEPAAE